MIRDLAISSANMMASLRPTVFQGDVGAVVELGIKLLIEPSFLLGNCCLCSYWDVSNCRLSKKKFDEGGYQPIVNELLKNFGF